MNFNQNTPYIAPVNVDPQDESREDRGKYRDEAKRKEEERKLLTQNIDMGIEPEEFLQLFIEDMQNMGEFDTNYKIFYRPLIDFGPGVGINESIQKYNLEKMNRDAEDELKMDDIAMNNNAQDFLKYFLQSKLA